MFVLSDPERLMIKFLQGWWEYEPNLGYDLFRLIHHNFASLFKNCHYSFNLKKICSNHKSNIFDCQHKRKEIT